MEILAPKIIFEDADILVIDKPAGMVVTNENRKAGEATVEDWIGAYHPNKLPRKGIVHRLDKGTSGILLVAKNKSALENLKNQFKKRQVKKIYLALAAGDVPQEGSVMMPIARSRYSFGRFKVDEEGKRAETEFEVVNKYRIDGRIYTLLKINLKTGRTHQIRVHMEYLKWPLAGDTTYGGPPAGGLNRPFLHAYRLRITHPGSREVMEFKSELPYILTEVLANGQVI